MKILGISCFYHDSAAAIIEDGKVVAAAQEERFSRIKHDSGFPEKTIDFCLKESKITSNEIDWIVFYEKPFLKFERITLSSISTSPFARELFIDAYKTWLKDKLWVKSKISGHLKISSKKILFCEHHISHAASSYYTSNFESAALLTVDGVGEWTTTAWGHAQKNKLFLENEIKFPHSLGLFYSTFTQFLGFRINNGEFKVMGLSPYGEPKYADKVEKLIHQSTDGAFKLDLSYFNFHLSSRMSFNQKFIDLFGVPPVDPKKSDKVVKVYADIASSAQKVLEDKLLVIAKEVRNKTGEDNLCYSGGVALNGCANWKIFKEAGFKNIYIHTAAGDSGGALGAALYVCHHVLNKTKRAKYSGPYLGYKNTEEEIENFLEENEIKAEKLNDLQLVDKVSDLLAKGKVVGWVRGKFEWGPRALGARSILADPRSKKMKDKVNAKIKFREAFRPFAPVCIYEKAKEYFDVGKAVSQQPLLYMLAVVPVQKEYQKRLGAITHVDGTARPQFIKRKENSMYYDLVEAFGKKTGMPILLNTSFNLKGEPIVNTASEAYKTFQESGIDVLVIENYLIKK